MTRLFVLGNYHYTHSAQSAAIYILKVNFNDNSIFSYKNRAYSLSIVYYKIYLHKKEIANRTLFQILNIINQELKTQVSQDALDSCESMNAQSRLEGNSPVTDEREFVTGSLPRERNERRAFREPKLRQDYYRSLLKNGTRE